MVSTQVLYLFLILRCPISTHTVIFFLSLLLNMSPWLKTPASMSYSYWWEDFCAYFKKKKDFIHVFWVLFQSIIHICYNLLFYLLTVSLSHTLCSSLLFSYIYYLPMYSGLVFSSITGSGLVSYIQTHVWDKWNSPTHSVKYGQKLFFFSKWRVTEIELPVA